jgi:hypothetical protein
MLSINLSKHLQFKILRSKGLCDCGCEGLNVKLIDSYQNLTLDNAHLCPIGLVSLFMRTLKYKWKLGS